LRQRVLGAEPISAGSSPCEPRNEDIRRLRDMEPRKGVFLRPHDIEAVADYVLANIKGKGEPNYAECVSFFGNTSRVCDIYKQGTVSSSSSSQTEQGK
jgi:hypothetical protein